MALLLPSFIAHSAFLKTQVEIIAYLSYKCFMSLNHLLIFYSSSIFSRELLYLRNVCFISSHFKMQNSQTGIWTKRESMLFLMLFRIHKSLHHGTYVRTKKQNIYGDNSLFFFEKSYSKVWITFFNVLLENFVRQRFIYIHCEWW